MMDGWYYTHNGQRRGPVSAEELDRLAADGALSPTDLLWRMGADRSTAVEAGTVIITLAQTTGYVPNRTPAPPESAVPSTSAAVPDWLADVKPVPDAPPIRDIASTDMDIALPDGAGSGTHAGPVPDWLDDMRQAQGETISPPAHANPRAATAEHGEKASTTPTEKKTEQSPKRPPLLHPPHGMDSSLTAVFAKAQQDLEAWVDAPANQALIMQGDIRVILGELTVQTLLARYRMHGAAVQERIRSQLRALIENRRRRQGDPAGEAIS